MEIQWGNNFHNDRGEINAYLDLWWREKFYDDKNGIMNFRGNDDVIFEATKAL